MDDAKRSRARLTSVIDGIPETPQFKQAVAKYGPSIVNGTSPVDVLNGDEARAAKSEEMSEKLKRYNMRVELGNSKTASSHTCLPRESRDIQLARDAIDKDLQKEFKDKIEREFERVSLPYESDVPDYETYDDILTEYGASDTLANALKEYANMSEPVKVDVDKKSVERSPTAKDDLITPPNIDHPSESNYKPDAQLSTLRALLGELLTGSDKSPTININIAKLVIKGD